MRTLRLSLAGTVILMLLAWPGGVVIAGDEEAPAPDRPHQVSGTQQDAGMIKPEIKSFEDGRNLRYGKGGRDTIEMDDARLSGTLWYVQNKDVFVGPVGPDGEVMSGTAELVNDDGSWVGTWRGYVAYEEFGRHYYLQFGLTGADAYEGLSTLLHAKGPYAGVRDVEGFVFPGVLPPYPDPVEPPAE